MSAFKMKATKGGGDYAKPPVGNHAAVLVAVIDMGTQESNMPGQKDRRQVYLLWELCNETIAGTSKNHVIGTALTFSFNEKATLRKWIENRTGKRIANDQEYDLASELGQPCMLNVIEQGGYPRIEGMGALPKGMPAPKHTYPLTILGLEEAVGEPGIPEWVPWHFGNPLIDHVKASREIGIPRPKRTKDAGPSAVLPNNVDGKDPIPF